MMRWSRPANKAMSLAERKGIQGRPAMFSVRRPVIIYSLSAGYCQRSADNEISNSYDSDKR
jgi:hypothetical protein